MSKVNGVEVREPADNREKQVLGFVVETARIIKYGKISLEITVRDGKLTNLQQTFDGAQIRKSVNLDCEN